MSKSFKFTTGTLKTNLVADMDSYKHGHPFLLHPGLTHAETYGEARIGGVYPYVAFAGMQAIVLKHFAEPVTKRHIEEAVDYSTNIHGVNPIDVETWEHVINKYGGYLPMTIKTVPEGTILKPSNVLFTTVSNDEKFARVMNGLETIQMHVWKPTAVLTRLAKIKFNIYPLFVQSGSVEGLDFAINDFGLRGTSCLEDGEISGMAALIATAGSDNTRAMRGLRNYYGAEDRQKSVYATEHSVALSFGRGDGELAYLRHILDTVPDGMIASIVIDTYDAHGFIRNVVGNSEMVERIKNREGRIVFRPDSGDPNVIVSNILDLLGEIFGFHYNSKGYKVLNHNVGVIQGDGMDEDSIPELYKTIMSNKWSADNLVVGSGGGLLVKDLNRDTQRFAIKPSYGIIDGNPINFKKNPATDPTKMSKSGQLKLHGFTPNTYATFSSADTSKATFNAYYDAMRVLFHNGEVMPEHFDVIKNRFEDHLRQLTSF